MLPVHMPRRRMGWTSPPPLLPVYMRRLTMSLDQENSHALVRPAEVEMAGAGCEGSGIRV